MRSLSLIAIVFFSTGSASAQAFITSWQTDDTEIIILTRGGGYNYDITWTNQTNPGQGNGSATGQTGNYTISALNNGDTYQVSITGDFPRIYFNNNAGQRDKILSIEQWGNISWTTMREAVRGCSNLTYNATDAPDLRNVTGLHSMFEGAGSFDGDLSSWDVSNVTDMSFMFSGATSFNGDVSTWNTVNVTNMDNMFRNASSFNGPLNNWSTGNVTNMRSMFAGATSFNQDLNNWDTRNVTTMRFMFGGATGFNGNIGTWNTSSLSNIIDMFNGASSFNRDINAWDVSNVTSLRGTFAFAGSFNQDLDNWNTALVTSMVGTFDRASSFNGDISTWNTANVTEMFIMFQGARNFNRDISSWDVGNVRNMRTMFNKARAFNQDIGNWNTSNVQTMRSTFFDASAFDHDLGAWDLSSVTDIRDMLRNSALSVENYDNTLIGWASQTVPSGLSLGSQGLIYSCHAEDERQSLIDDDGWSISGDASSVPVPDVPALSDITASCEVTSLPDPGVSSSLGSVTITNDASLPITTQGNFVVTWTYTDPVNCSVTQMQNIIIDDVTLPTPTTQDIMVALDATGNRVIAPNQVDDGSADDCGVAALALDRTNFSCADLGANTITLTVTDHVGNNASKTATVTIVDDLAPAVVTQNVTLQLDAFGNASLALSQIDNGSDDNCGISSLTLDKTDFSCADLGVNAVNLTAEDGSGHSTSMTASVTVQDNIVPTIAAQDLTVELDASGNASITAAQVDNGSNDNCSIASLSLDRTDFDCTEIGANTVTLTAMDGSGNISSATVTITIVDNAAPQFSLQDLTIALDADGLAVLSAEDISHASVDNCGIQRVDLDRSEFSCNDLGNNSINLSIFDQNRNRFEASATVEVRDNLPPVLSSCPTDITATDPVVFYDPPEAIDNCSVSSVLLVEGLESGSQFPLGTTLVTYELMDPSGNATTCSFRVMIDEVDFEPDIPTAFSPNGDGVNDTWNILNLDRYPNARLRVFDISGHQVFSSIGYLREWDGRYRGKILPGASYYYILDLNDQNDRKLKGKITIIR